MSWVTLCHFIWWKHPYDYFLYTLTQYAWNFTGHQRCEESHSCVYVSLYQLSIHGHSPVCGSSWLHSLHCDSKLDIFYTFSAFFFFFKHTTGLSGEIRISCLPVIAISYATICCCCQLLIKVLQPNQFTTSWPRVTTKSFQKLLSS